MKARKKSSPGWTESKYSLTPLRTTLIVLNLSLFEASAAAPTVTTFNALRRSSLRAAYKQDSRYLAISGSQKRSENEVNILYRITVSHDLDDQLLRSIRTIGIFGVKVEPLKNRSVVQCFNFQRLSHTARQCHFTYRCVKCCSQHSAGSCPRNSNPNISVACINYKEDGLQHTAHSANQYGSCNFFKKNFNSGESNRHPTMINRRPLERPQPTVAAQQATRTTKNQQTTGPTRSGSSNPSSFPGTKPGQATWAQIAGGKRVDDPMLHMMAVFRELLPKLIQIGECFQL